MLLTGLARLSTLLSSDGLLLTVRLSLLRVVELRVTSSSSGLSVSSRSSGSSSLLGSSGRGETLLLLLSAVSVVRLLESGVVRGNLLERLGVVTGGSKQIRCQFPSIF